MVAFTVGRCAFFPSVCVGLCFLLHSCRFIEVRGSRLMLSLKKKIKVEESLNSVSFIRSETIESFMGCY
jgi:hypothetical protein